MTETETSRTPGPSWSELSRDGRAFLRAGVPDPPGHPGLPLTLARLIAGRYEPTGLLAAGAIGAVVTARDVRTGREVLVKILRPEVVLPPPGIPGRSEVLAEEIRRLRHALQTERRLLVRLRNLGCANVPLPIDYAFDRNLTLEDPPFAEGPGAPAPLDRSVVEAEPYLVLGRVPGVGLDAILEHDARDGLPAREALRLIRPVVATLARLHEPWRTATGRTWHCLYLDLKPSNLIVDPAGRATLLDFGGCQVVIDGVLVLEGGFTRGYAPPECEGPPRVLLPNADVYTVGSTLFQMVTGIHPTERRGGSREMRLLERKAGSALAGLIGRCLAERPSDRPADATRLGEALDALGG